MFDHQLSSDVHIRAMAQRRDELAALLQHSRLWMMSYVEQIREPQQRPAISLQEHYSMLDQEECGCATCMEWEQRREEFTRAIKLVPKNHKWTVCACNTCRFVGRFQLNLLAAANRRELLIEMSFHARYHSYHGELVMDWISKEMQNPSYTINWCAQEMNRYPMERWIKRCENAVSGVIGGPVFVNSTMMTDAIANLGSSLAAEVVQQSQSSYARTGGNPYWG